jgi:hypothetical protein
MYSQEQRQINSADGLTDHDKRFCLWNIIPISRRQEEESGRVEYSSGVVKPG